MKYPTQVKEIANELVKVCNDYKSRKISNEEIKEIVLYYAKEYPSKLFNNNDLNPTIKKIIGQQRIGIIKKLTASDQDLLLYVGENYDKN